MIPPQEYRKHSKNVKTISFSKLHFTLSLWIFWLIILGFANAQFERGDEELRSSVVNFINHISEGEFDTAYSLIANVDRVSISKESFPGAKLVSDIFYLAEFLPSDINSSVLIETEDLNNSTIATAKIEITLPNNSSYSLSLSLVREEETWRITDLGDVFPAALVDRGGEPDVEAPPDKVNVHLPDDVIYDSLPRASESNLNFDQLFANNLNPENNPIVNGLARPVQTSEIDLAHCQPEGKVFCTEENGVYIFLTKLVVDEAEMLKLHINWKGGFSQADFWVWGQPSDINADEIPDAVHFDTSYFQFNEEFPSIWTPTVLGPEVWLQIQLTGKPPAGRNLVLFIDRVMEIFPLNIDGLPVITDEKGLHIMEKSTMPLETFGINVTCKVNEGIVSEKVRSAIVHIGSVVNSDVYTYCSGARILSNRDPDKFYILTARHCLPSGEVNANEGEKISVELFWDYYMPTCSDNQKEARQFSPQEMLNLPNISRKVTFLVSRCETDVALLKTDPVGYDELGYRSFLGWSLAPHPIQDLRAWQRVSHPHGVSQAFTAHKSNPNSSVASQTFCDQTENNGIQTEISEGSLGTRSSGSVLFDAHSLVLIGQLSNGEGQTSIDGLFSSSWQFLGKYLK